MGRAAVAEQVAAGGQAEEDEARAERAREFAGRTIADLEAELYKRRGELEAALGNYPESRAIPVIGRRAEALAGEITRRALEALRWAWDGVYQITESAGVLEAWRMDGTGTVHGGTPGELRAAILEDYARMPVTPR